MDASTCTFFAGSVAEWAAVVVTLLTGAAIAWFALVANRATDHARQEFKDHNLRRARAFGYSIMLELGSAPQAYYRLREGLLGEINGQKTPSIDNLRSIQKQLDIPFLPSVSQSIGNVDLLPEGVVVNLLAAMASVQTIRRSLAISLESPLNVENSILTPPGMENIQRICVLLTTLEDRFRTAHRALWKFIFPDEPIVEWQSPDVKDTQTLSGN